MTIQEKLQIIQKLSGLSQENLAHELHVSFVTLNSWINNRSQPHTKKTSKNK
jgi:Helix-turn-helix.